MDLAIKFGGSRAGQSCYSVARETHKKKKSPYLKAKRKTMSWPVGAWELDGWHTSGSKRQSYLGTFLELWTRSLFTF